MSQWRWFFSKQAKSNYYMIYLCGPFLGIFLFIGSLIQRPNPINLTLGLKFSTELARNDTISNRKQIVFKSWLRDTLRHFSSESTLIAKTIKRYSKKIIVSKDSLLFNIAYRYNLTVYPGQKIRSKNVLSVLTLLNEYKEQPKASFNLRFIIYYEYIPTPLESENYDLYSYISDLEIRSDSNKAIARYSYVKGRLSGKIVTDKTLESKTKMTEFIWDGPRLIKKEFVTEK